MKLLLLIILPITIIRCDAQSLFTYGNHQVSKKQFLDAFNKNGNFNSSVADYRQYLELFARYKLKVQAAYDMKLDTTAAQKKELADYKIQLVDSYTAADSITNILVKQEFVRSLKDIELGLIYIPVSTGAIPDSVVAAEKNIRQAYRELEKSNSFEAVARKYSRDPSVGFNGGRVGYVTAFVLPYAIENVLYSLSRGSFSKPFRAKSGWLIVKNFNERPAAGRVQVSQILIGYPEGGTTTERLAARTLIDSVYTLLRNGQDFKSLASTFSHDLFSYQDGGLLPAFGSGTYDALFEGQAFGLNKPGELTKPFETGNGFHILRLEKKLVTPATLDSAARQEIMQLISTGDRMDWIQQRTTENLKAKTGFKQVAVDKVRLNRHTVYMTEHPDAAKGILNSSQQLFTIGAKSFLVADYNRFIKALAVNEDLNGNLYDHFVLQCLKEQYARKLGVTNADYQQQVAEFKEANLLFAVMQQRVWNAATEDSAGLRAYYNKHSSNYKWEPSADALIFTVADETIAENFKTQLQKSAVGWRQLVDNTPGMQADSGRFELGQIPVADRTAFSETLITSNQHVENSPMVNFGYVIKLYPAGEPKSFQDAMGQVISDYQLFLEEKWIAELKNKYPVKVNEEVFRSLETR